MIKYFLQLPILQQILILYLILINIITFFYFGIDKIKAQLSSRRISEKMLWLLTLIGGSLGGLLGMHFFRHKTKKLSFQVVLAVILALQVVLVVWLVM